MKKIVFTFLLAVVASAALAVGVFAEADDVAAPSVLTAAGADEDIALVCDGDLNSFVGFAPGGTVSVSSGTPIAGVYVRFYVKGAVWTLSANGAAENETRGYVHDYVPVGAPTGELTISFPDGAQVAELSLFTEGGLPDDVQVWEPPLDGGADLVMFSSHADDEQLFFSGTLPDSVAKGAKCQVVYFCDHSPTPQRVHEQLNGLWTVGVRYYPVFGVFPDLYSESREGGEAVFADSGYGYGQFIAWQVENIRRFRPQVLLIHDEAGEYGHGTHIINSYTARDAVTLAADPSAEPDSADKYGVWDTPKVYMHLYPEHAIVLDFDTPLDYFGGKTAYEMSCLGFGKHYSQHWTWFYEWMYGPSYAPYTTAAQIDSYSPCRWGLWRTTVGYDTRADFFENIVLLKDQTPPPPETEATDPPETEPETETAEETGKADEGTKKESGRRISLAVPAVLVVAAAIILSFSLTALRRRGAGKRRRN
ncbi:MAG: PIG-L family deacetylase [Clostridia bacterium]|nr:PIG-L family deacetylase [Clostridia bacterium]